MLVGIILAAGFGTRMGQNKMLAKLNKKPLLHYVLDAAEGSSLENSVVVTGFEHTKVKNSIALRDHHLPLYAVGTGLTLVNNPDFAQGLSTSLQTGLYAALEKFPQMKGAMILLGDMPFLTPPMLNALIAAFEKETDIIVPCYKGEKGNPVLWGKAHFEKLLTLTGDKGARELLKILPSKAIELSHEAVILDIDTPEILQTFQK